MNKKKFVRVSSIILSALLCANMMFTGPQNMVFATDVNDTEVSAAETVTPQESEVELTPAASEDTSSQPNEESELPEEPADEPETEPTLEPTVATDVVVEEQEIEAQTNTEIQQNSNTVYPEGDFSMIIADPNSEANENNADLNVYPPITPVIESAPGVTYHSSPIWHDRRATYYIFSHDYDVIECNRRYGSYFYTASGNQYHVDYVHKFVEIINMDEQLLTVTQPAILYSQPMDVDEFDTGILVPNGTYATSIQSSGRYYIETPEFKGWIDADRGVEFGNLQELEYARPFLPTNNVSGVPVSVLLIPETNGVTRPASVIRPLYVTIHNTGVNGAGADAYAHANLQYRGNSAQSSWHFSVDDREIWQSVPMDEMAYHAGDGAAMGNAGTIGIEICENSDGNYAQAERNAAKLTALILHTQGLPADAVKQHYDWNGKNCPQNIREMSNGSMGWTAFLAMVAQEYAKLGPVTYGGSDTNTANVTGQATGKSASEPTLTYEAISYIKGSSGLITEPNSAGTTGQFLGMHSITLNVSNAPNATFIANTYIDGHGTDLTFSSEPSITVGLKEQMPLEVLNYDLVGLDGYKLQYRVHSSNIGWQAWVDEGKDAGVKGNNIQAVDFRLVKSNDTNTEETQKTTLYYQTHVQDVGWQGWKTNGEASGTSGKSLRLEAIQITPFALDGTIEYRTHIQNVGWESEWRTDGDISGTSGKSLRLEAIEIKLTGNAANEYDVYYRVHAEHFGWLDWAKNGESAGTAGYGYRLEAIEIELVKKGDAAPGKTTTPYEFPYVTYTTHVEDVGWQDYVLDGATAGTYGKSLRLEGIRIQLPEQDYAGNILYRTHIQNIGWETSWKTNGQTSGTSGKSLRLEAIEIKLDGELAENFDVYYRVHAQHYGWMGWAKNGAPAGTAGYSYRLEGIQIMLVEKGDKAPSSTAKAYIEK